MKLCRICGALLGDPVYASSGTSITSVRSAIDAPLIVYLCPACLHAQKPALHRTSDYYDREYRISLESDEFDQLYDKVGDRCIYRTDYQAELVLQSVDIPVGAKVLDYGAGKATTLRKVSAARTDLVPYVFDVSENYKKSWQTFVPSGQQATYQIPESWKRTFSLITVHFVVEHVEDPCLFFQTTAGLLADGGAVFFTVPDLLTNPGDLLAIDHINHFSLPSISAALATAGMEIVKIDTGIFRGAIVCVARRSQRPASAARGDVAGFADKLRETVRFWSKFDAHLAATTGRLHAAPSAIFGAGVYGSYIAAKIKDRVAVKCFLDNSPHLRNSNHMGLPVLAPRDIPEDVRVIYAGLNPGIARRVLEPLRTEAISEIIYFDEGAFEHD